MTAKKPAGRGRPFKGGRDPMVSARLPEDLVKRIDTWANNHEFKPSRSAAVRRLIKVGLDASDAGWSPDQAKAKRK